MVTLGSVPTAPALSSERDHADYVQKRSKSERENEEGSHQPGKFGNQKPERRQAALGSDRPRWRRVPACRTAYMSPAAALVLLVGHATYSAPLVVMVAPSLTM